MTASVRWAIAGSGEIGTFFAAALARSSTGVLHAVASRDAGRARRFADAHGAPVAGSYAEVFARDDVDAVYVATVHTTHAEIAVAALNAGKAVLCEKPLAVSVDETAAMITAAGRTGLPLVEAFKYRFGPFADALRMLVADGAIGDIVEIETSFGFAAEQRAGRLFDPGTAGGAILDAGCYPVSLAVGVAAWRGGSDADPVWAQAHGEIGETGVDEWATATLEVGGLRASLATSITRELPRSAVLRGTAGTIEIPNVWGARTESAATAVVRDVRGHLVHTVKTPVVDPMAAEADAVGHALREGRTEAPEMPWRESLVIARLLADWRAAI